MATQFTPSIAIPYPPATDNNDNQGAIQAIVTFLDPIIEGSYTAAEIAAFTAAQKWAGRRLFNSTRACYQWYDGANWLDEQSTILNPQAGAAYTLVLADANCKTIQMTNAGANQLLVPTNAAVPFPINTVINGFQYGAGQTSVVAVTPGTTAIRATPGAKTRAQYSAFTLLKIAVDEWLLSGDIVP